MKPTTIAGIIVGIVAIGSIATYVSRPADPEETTAKTPDQEGVFCTMEAKQCPDGSYVGRSGPNCEFAACPGPAKADAPVKDPAATTGSTVDVASVTVSYTDSGFSPRDITISKGTTVTFVNDSSRDMWPASDDHPTHTIYSEFDPKRRIAPGSTYSFIFGKVGSWEYHDHLRASQTGTVTVH